MAEKKDSKIITIILTFIIIVAIVTLVYVNLPVEETKEKDNSQNEDNNNNITPVGEEILSIIFDSQEVNFKLSELETLEAYSGAGSYIKTKVLPEVIINGPYNYTGVKFSTLINQIENIPENYNIIVTSSDGWTTTYTMNQVDGENDIYNETGNIIEKGTVTMILAYKEEGEYINEEDVGPLRIAFVGEDVITASSLWSKMVKLIEVIEV